MVDHAIVVTFTDTMRTGMKRLFSPLKHISVQYHEPSKSFTVLSKNTVVFFELSKQFSPDSDTFKAITALQLPIIAITEGDEAHVSLSDQEAFTEVLPLAELNPFWLKRVLKSTGDQQKQLNPSESLDKSTLVIQEVFNRFPIKIALYDKELRFEFLNEYAHNDIEVRNWAIGKTLDELQKHIGEDADISLRTQKMKECLRIGKHITWYENLRKEKGLSYQLFGAFPMLNSQNEVQSLVTYSNNITNEMVAEKSLRFRIGFEKLLTEYSNKLINISSLNLDQVIEQCIADIGRYVETDRVYIFIYGEDEDVMSNTHEWCNEKIQPFKEELQQLKISEFSYLISILKKTSCLNIDDINDLPPEAVREREEFKRQGIQSILWAPLRVNHKIIGFVGFDAVGQKRQWSEELQEFIKLSAQVISNALERKKSERALVNSEEKFRTLTEKAHAAIFITQDFRFVYANPETSRITGYSEDELLTKNFIEMFDLEEKTSALQSEKKIKEDENYNARNERKILTKNGTPKYIDITSNKIRYNDEDAIISIAFDVTEKHKKDEEEKELIQKLIEQNLDLEQFSYITSHNLRSPVAGIQGLISILEKEKMGSDLNKEVVNRIGIAANKLDVVIKDLNFVINMRNKSTQNRKEIVLSHLIGEIVDTHKEMVEQNETTVLQDFYEAPSIHTVRGYITSILTNLLTNAIKYRKPNVPPIIIISSRKVGATIELSVADNGLGLDLEKYGQRLFKFKQRFHQNIEGHGMGLYLVRTQVHSLGGSVSVESELGKGSTFTVVLKR